jgi:hypothetical protein
MSESGCHLENCFSEMPEVFKTWQPQFEQESSLFDSLEGSNEPTWAYVLSRSGKTVEDSSRAHR